MTDTEQIIELLHADAEMSRRIADLERQVAELRRLLGDVDTRTGSMRRYGPLPEPRKREPILRFTPEQLQALREGKSIYDVRKGK